MINLSKAVKISSAVTPTAGVAGTSDINGTTLDMSGFQSCLVVVRMGTITSTAVTSIKLQQGALSDASDMADLLGTAQTIADDDDDETFYIDIHQPTERYIRLVVDRGTANAVVASASYIQYNPDLMPTTHGTGVSGEFHQSPAEGTA
jgi:hypothetical protein